MTSEVMPPWHLLPTYPPLGKIRDCQSKLNHAATVCGSAGNGNLVMGTLLIQHLHVLRRWQFQPHARHTNGAANRECSAAGWSVDRFESRRKVRASSRNVLLGRRPSHALADAQQHWLPVSPRARRRRTPRGVCPAKHRMVPRPGSQNIPVSRAKATMPSALNCWVTWMVTARREADS